MAQEPVSTSKAQAAKRHFSFAVSIGMLLGALTLQWSSVTAEQQKQRDEGLFSANSCNDHFPPPWRTHKIGHSASLEPSIQAFGLPSCASFEFRPSTCNDSHFLVRCYAEDQRKGLWHVYRIELEKDEIYSVMPDLT